MPRYCKQFIVVCIAIALIASTGFGIAAAEDKLSISWLGINPKGVLQEKDSLVELYLEQKFNVDLEPWYDVDSYDTQRLNIKIAAGEVPDVFRGGKSPASFVEMGVAREVPKELISHRLF